MGVCIEANRYAVAPLTVSNSPNQIIKFPAYSYHSLEKFFATFLLKSLPIFTKVVKVEMVVLTFEVG